eukprot:XP_014781030.1 PREDICTED: uncharacterized protein LOC106876828 [Octopus bimaculoides]
MASFLFGLEAHVICKGATQISHRWLHKFGSRYLQSGRLFSTTTRLGKSLILGVYEASAKDSPLVLSQAAKYFDEKYSGKLSQQIKLFGKSFKKGKSHLLFGLCEEFPLLAVANLGKEDQGFNELEGRHEGHESVRTAVAKSVLQLRDAGEDLVSIDPCGDPMAAAEGASLSLHSYDELKPQSKQKPKVELACYTDHLEAFEKTSFIDQWHIGEVYADAQNFARLLTEMPANILTPTKFSEMVIDKLSSFCQIVARDQAWVEEQKMGAFLCVSQGSGEPLKFLELSYNNSSDKSAAPIVLVGKGITFDTGGISLKPANNMDKMRGDMGGAACVVGTILGVCKLGLPIHLKALIPLCENMPGSRAVKPGDVVTAMNGTTIQVDNTDAEGRLILADALCYAETLNPKLILDMATLTGAITIALGSGASGTYTNSPALWDLLYKEFIQSSDWIHLDISGVRTNQDEVPYLGRGMSVVGINPHHQHPPPQLPSKHMNKGSNSNHTKLNMASSVLRTAANVTKQIRPSRVFLLNGSVIKGRLLNRRQLSTTARLNKGLILGVYEASAEDGPLVLSKAAKHFDEKCSGKLSEQIKLFGKSYKKGKSHLLFGLCEEFPLLAVVNLGKEGQGFNELECRHEGHESVRTAVARGVLQMQQAGEGSVFVDPSGNAKAAAEGADLSSHCYDELKPKKSQKTKVESECYMDHLDNSEGTKTKEQWNHGKIYAEAQNFARLLMEMPSNILTPSKFAEMVSEKLSSLCQVSVRDQSWAEEQKMGSFLSVSRGSAEPLRFLELTYKNTSDSSIPPVALVGKGITFDTGGISLKPANDMDKMRGDMGGAACVVGTMLGVCKLELPIYVKAFIPLCENMPGGKATKPGDVVTAMNGKTIQVDNTDAEGRLILADALCYAETFQPKFILDMATLTGAVDVALGSAATGAYTNSTNLWNHLFEAGSETGDRLWRLPLFQHYTVQVTHSQLAAINNVGKHSRAGGSCTAAAFLKEFVESSDWIHLDIAGVMSNKDEVAHLGSGMSGRPTRTVIELLTRFTSQQ